VLKLKNRGVVVLTVLGLFALSGLALADTQDDTVVNYTYDADEDFLALNISSLAYEPDYEAAYETFVDACTLEGEGPFDLSYDGETVALSDAGGDVTLEEGCEEIVGGFVYGPNGQVNHGTVMKFLNSIYQGPGRGCVISQFAQMDLGKTDQQEPDPEFEVPEVSEEAPLVIEGAEFMTFETNCLHGNKGGNGGPPQSVLEKHADKWGEDGPGKPDHAGGPGGRP
jgi:hypothetical protein